MILAVLLSLVGCGFIPASEREWRLDPDGDGAEWPLDCDDDDPTVGAGPPWFFDQDRDGYGGDEVQDACATPGEGWVRTGGDCGDADPTIHPGATERCDGVDQDCDGALDNGFANIPVFADEDGDGYGGLSAGEACAIVPGISANTGDCDDTNADAHPHAVEVCNDVDDDCDGEIDEALIAVWWVDADGDGFGDPATATETCDPDPTWVARAEDCDDTYAGSNPDAYEVCDDGRDNDCNGTADDEHTRYLDLDGDGFGDPSTERTACDADRYEVDNNVDCDDADSAVNPAVPEVCDDGVDNDCDGVDDTCEAG